MALIAVKHNIEVAHRLYESLPGNKCENIHGHSMWVTLELKGEIKDGLLEGIDFGSLKKDFRGHLDEHYDHRLLLNASDPLAGPIFPIGQAEPSGWQNSSTGEEEPILYEVQVEKQMWLPGLQTFVGDPTTENIAQDIGLFMRAGYPRIHAVEVWETSVNMARWENWNG